MASLPLDISGRGLVYSAHSLQTSDANWVASACQRLFVCLCQGNIEETPHSLVPGKITLVRLAVQKLERRSYLSKLLHTNTFFIASENNE